MSEPLRGDQVERETKKNIRGSGLLLVGRVISVGLNFLVQIAIVRYLSKEGYGAFAYGYSIVSLAARMLPIGTDRAVTRFIPIYQEQAQFARIKGSLVVVLVTLCTISALLVGTVISARNVLSGSLVRDPLSLSVLLAIISLAPLVALENLLEKMLAVLGRVKSLFFRRYLLTPLLRLAAVGSLMLVGGDAVFLAVGYVLATLVGVLVSTQLLWRVLREEGLLDEFSRLKAEYPTQRLFRFGTPLLSSDIVFGLRTSLVILLLEWFHGTAGVAAFRAILPIARLNQVVFDSFRLLYVPTASRLFGRGQTQQISQLYWQTSSWIAVLTFPVLLVSFSLAQPMVVLLFGGAYADSGPVLSIVALGLYLNAVFGFNTLTLRVFDRVRTIMSIDLAAAAMALLLNLAIVPRFGPLGGAVVLLVVLLVQNMAYQISLYRAGQLAWIPAHVAAMHTVMLGLAGLLWSIQSLFAPPLLIGCGLAALATMVVWAISHKTLPIRQCFPEFDRFLPPRLFPIDAVPSPTVAQDQTS